MDSNMILVMKTGETVEVVETVIINDIPCHDVRVIDPGTNEAVQGGMTFMLMQPELERNTL